MLPGGGKGGSNHLLTTTAPTGQQQQADTEQGARRMLPGGGRGDRGIVRSWFVTLRPLRGPANTMRAQGPKPCPSNET
jgi:hypothetical protein